MQTENWQTLVKEQQFNDVLMEWNAKINLVSRKKLNVLDLIEDSKLFFKGINFKPGDRLLDLGTGGGLPGIVIAINHPEMNLVLVDSIEKENWRCEGCNKAAGAHELLPNGYLLTRRGAG